MTNLLSIVRNLPVWQYLSPRVVHIFLLVVLTSLAFSNTLDNDYHLDSIYRVKINTEINQFWPPARFFTDLRTGSTIPEIAAYRPLMPLSHSINSEISRATGSSKLTGFHIGNIAIHIGSAILVYFLFCLLLANWGTGLQRNLQSIDYRHQAFAAALIFALHPVSGSAVNYVAARDLLLMVFFFTASLLVYFNMRRNGDSVSGWLIALLLLWLAILSKQVAIVGFGMIFLFELILMDTKLKDWSLWVRTAIFSIPTAAYFVLYSLWIAPKSTANPLRIPTDLYYPLTMAKAHVFYYMKNIVWPFEMRALAKFDKVESMLDPAALAGLVFIVSTLVLAWWLRRRVPLITFAILAYWLLFTLTASIFPFRYIVTDYRQYLPFAFFCMIVSLAIFSLVPRVLPLLLLTTMILYFSLSTFHINTHWKSEESFWRQSVEYGAVSLAHSNYGLIISHKNPELAETHYLEALRQYPAHIYANMNLGLLYIKQRKIQEGLTLLRENVGRNPNRAVAHYWLSRGLKMSKLGEESLVELRRAADLDQRLLDYQYQAAQALQASGDRAASIVYLDRLIQIDPNYKLTGFLLGFAYQKQNDNRRAISEYIRFLENQPRHIQARFNLAYALMNEGDCTGAIEHFKTVIALKPRYWETHLHLSRCFRSLGHESLAVKHEAIYKNDG